VRETLQGGIVKRTFNFKKESIMKPRDLSLEVFLESHKEEGEREGKRKRKPYPVGQGPSILRREEE